MASSRSSTSPTSKEPLVKNCIQLQETLVEMAKKLQRVEDANTATREKNKMMEVLIEDLIHKAGAVKNVGTSPPTRLRSTK